MRSPSEPKCRARPGRRGRAYLARRRVALLATAAALAACDRSPTHVTEPPGLARAVPFLAKPPYALWWSLTEACSGLRGDLATIRFAAVPGPPSVGVIGGDSAGGYWLDDRREIVLAEPLVFDGQAVRHEMLHALIGRTTTPNHPFEYFGRRCAGYVNCSGGACLREVAAQAPPLPADARAVATTDLRVGVAAVPSAFPADTNGGFFVVVVSATNPFAVPVWVGAADGGESSGFGYEAAPVLEWGVLRGRLLLQPGETREAVFDLTTDPHEGVQSFLLPGTYALLGHFGDALTDPVELRIDSARAPTTGRVP